ncbi:MAG: hypothetical protein ACFB2X_15085 [Rivularia sp. (in: cyanobacteria)]
MDKVTVSKKFLSDLIDGTENFIDELDNAEVDRTTIEETGKVQYIIRLIREEIEQQ